MEHTGLSVGKPTTISAIAFPFLKYFKEADLSVYLLSKYALDNKQSIFSLADM